ncbi:hypothetical protein [Paucibacter sp. XJ19-41]|uniref:hypothetical protein n=1 Tax=Paucibacter sp. XJ19-41 TaxID=2927824 RepID=UPI00234B4285|nr:hypothetical protein [Paucibacter sp. XJ19-41]MDC6169482.1 hypothetical protein [Paucibacter sp. XJ19-41]
MLEWEPIAETALRKRIVQGQARMSLPQLRLWEAIRIEPVKWQQHPYGDQGGGFWVVAIIGASVIWYNDIEEGFNRSRYSQHGTIDDYWCNQDELELTMQYLVNAIEQGSDLVLLRSRPARLPR